MKRLMLSLVLCVCMMLVPTIALADEVSPIDGFTNGLGDFFNPEVDERVTNRPRVREVGENDPESSDINSISDVVDAWSTVPIGTGHFDLLTWLQIFFGHSTAGFVNYLFMPVALGLVFVWWGVRKVIRMIFAAQRKGSISA